MVEATYTNQRNSKLYQLTTTSKNPDVGGHLETRSIRMLAKQLLFSPGDITTLPIDNDAEKNHGPGIIRRFILVSLHPHLILSDGTYSFPVSLSSEAQQSLLSGIIMN